MTRDLLFVRTLRRRLLLGLGVPMLVLLAISLWFDYRNAVRLANDINDHNLDAAAMVLAEHLEEPAGREQEIVLQLPTVNPVTGNSAALTQATFALVTTSGRPLAGDPELANLAARLRKGDGQYHDTELHGERFRAASYPVQLPAGDGVLSVALTTGERDATVMPILMRGLWPNILQIVTTLAIILLGIRHSLRPLLALGERIAAHPAADLQPLPMREVPAEVAPLAESINRLIDDLRSKSESQQAFLANASHQLRTPLARLQTQLELLSGALDAEARQRIAPLMETSRQLGHFTHQMLVLARSGRDADLSHEFAPTDLAVLLEEAASHFLDAALAKGIDLGFEPAPAVVSGSAGLLRELLANLLDNAIAYTPAQGHVTARCTTRASGAAVLEVEDDGPPIAPEIRAHIFERFVRGDAGTPGTGLGLAIVAEIARRHGAEVHLLQNETAGAGNCFQVVFPAPRHIRVPPRHGGE